MPEENTANIEAPDVALPSQVTTNKACDKCRTRKIRCDRRTPCSPCQRTQAQCTITPRAVRPKRIQALTSRYEEKIDLIDKRLDRMGHLINTFVEDDVSHSTSSTLASPTPSISSHSSRLRDVTSKAATNTASPFLEDEYRSPNTEATAGSEQEYGMKRIAEGQSSLSAHSTLAIDFLRKVAGADRQRGHNFETRELLDSLHQISDAIKTQRLSPDGLLTLGRPSAPAGREDSSSMPPIQAAVPVIQKAQVQRDIVLLFLSELFPSQSLSDLCLKVYFSQDYSTAEFIIVNFALYYLFEDAHIGSTDQQASSTSFHEHALLCQRNLETALFGLPLCIKPTHDMILALVLGAIYAVEISKPSLAWTLVSAAYQASYSLGCHTRAHGADEWRDTPNPLGLLFWVIYFLEKTLCLRLGRCSAILDIEITVPLPGDTPAMNYCRNSVRLASVAAQTFEKLYSAHALALPDDTRKQRALELSKELHMIQQQSRSIIETWPVSGVSKGQSELIKYISTSDEVLWYSMQTLIHRAIPAAADSPTSIATECISSARSALARHQLSVYAMTGPALLSSYINWTILFSPFIPFLVLFCHVLETGDREDLDRMQTFLYSIEPACQLSKAIFNHHRLFQVFHNVALRYTELKLFSTPTHDGQDDFGTEMDAYLSVLGFQPHAGPNMVADDPNISDGRSRVPPTMLSSQMQTDASDGDRGAELPSQLANWYSVSQQMMGLLDSDQLPF